MPYKSMFLYALAAALASSLGTTSASAASTTCAAVSVDEQLTYVLAAAGSKGGTPAVTFDTNAVKLLDNARPHNFYGYTTVWKTTDANAFSVKEGSFSKGPGRIDLASKSSGGIASVKLLADVDDPVLFKASGKALATYSPKDPLFQSTTQPSFVRTFTLGPNTAITFNLSYEMAAELDELQATTGVVGIQPAAFAAAFLGAGVMAADGVARPEYADRQLTLRHTALPRNIRGDRRMLVGTVTRTLANDTDQPVKAFVAAMASIDAIVNVGHTATSSSADMDQESTHEAGPAESIASSGKAPVLCRE